MLRRNLPDTSESLSAADLKDLYSDECLKIRVLFETYGLEFPPTDTATVYWRMARPQEESVKRMETDRSKRAESALATYVSNSTWMAGLGDAEIDVKKDLFSKAIAGDEDMDGGATHFDGSTFDSWDDLSAVPLKVVPGASEDSMDED